MDVGRPVPKSDSAQAARVTRGSHPNGQSFHPVLIRNNRSQPQSQAGSATIKVTDEPPTFIGPTGYDVNN